MGTNIKVKLIFIILFYVYQEATPILPPRQFLRSETIAHSNHTSWLHPWNSFSSRNNEERYRYYPSDYQDTKHIPYYDFGRNIAPSDGRYWIKEDDTDSDSNEDVGLGIFTTETPQVKVNDDNNATSNQNDHSNQIINQIGTTGIETSKPIVKNILNSIVRAVENYGNNNNSTENNEMLIKKENVTVLITKKEEYKANLELPAKVENVSLRKVEYNIKFFG